MPRAGVIKEALPHSLDSIFTEHYAIPEFQRPYIWKKKNIFELFDDIHDAQSERGRDDYFIGSLVVYRGKDGRLNLVDGQQRIITLTLLYCACRDRILDINQAADTKFFDGLVRGHRRTARGRSIEEDRILAQSYPDREILAEIIEGKGPDMNAQSYPGGQRWLIYAFKDLLDKVASTFGSEIKSIRNFGGFIAKNVQVVRIETDTFQSALQIFETINAKGVNLSAMDLVKNYLFSLVSAADRSKLKDAWSKVTDNLDDASGGARLATSSTRFLRYFVMSQYEIDKDRVIQASGIYDWVRKNALDGKLGAGSSKAVLDFTREMEKSSRAYSYIVAGQYPSRKKRQTHLKAISLLGVTVRQHVPLLMAARQHPEPVIDVLAEAAERMVVIYTLSGAQWNEVESVIPLWSRLIRGASSEASMRRFVSDYMDPKIETHVDAATANLRSLGSLGDSAQRYVLARLTQYVEDETGQGGPLERFFNGKTVTIEHILPQKPSGASLDPFDKIASDDLPDYIYALGNLCLLNQVANSLVGIKPFSAKAPVYRKFGQFLLTRAVVASIAVGRNTKYTRMERRLKHYRSWSPKSVESRTENLVALARGLWRL